MHEIIISAITLVLNSFLGLFSFFRNPKSWTNRLLFLLTIFIDLYVVVNYLSLHPLSPTPDSQLFWIRVVMCVCSFIGPTLVLLIHTFPDDAIRMRKRFLIPMLALCVTSATAALSPLIFSGIEYPQGQPVPIPGPLIPLFFIDFVGLFIFSIFLLVYKYRKSTGVVKTQHMYFLFGAFLTFTLMGLSTVVFVVIFKYSGLVFLGPNAMIFMVMFIAYAIVRHKLLDMRLIVARSVAYFLVVLALIFSYSLGIFVVGTYIIGYEIKPANMLVSVFFAFIIAVSYHPLLRKLEHFTDRLFFKDAYDTRFLLAKLGRIMASTLELEEIARLILKTMLRDIKISKGYMLLTREKQIIWSYGHGYNRPLSQNFVGEYIDFLIEAAQKKEGDNVLLFDELPDGAIKDIMREYDMGVAFPLVVDKKPIGLMWLSQKLSGEIYSGDDLHVFKILSPEIAVAIKNSLQYNEIKEFNITLQEKIKHATSNLRMANQKLKELDKMKDDFVSVASHELRTPMTAIKSYLWMALAGKGGKLTTKQEFYLQRSYNSVDRLIKLVNDMLNISRIESDRIFINLTKVDVAQLLQDCVEEVKPRADELKIKLGLDFDEKGSIAKNDMKPVIADPDKIKEVIFNFIGNSLKFTPEGGEIKIFFTKDEDRIVVNVKDTGRGIDAKDMGTLFTKFGMIQGSYATNKKASGTGLGLYISKSIIELHDGEIKAASEGIDKGSTFSFSLQVFSKTLLDSMSQKLNTGKRDQTIGIIHTSI